MFVLIAGSLVSRGVNVKVMPPVLVSICVNVLAAASCVKFSIVSPRRRSSRTRAKYALCEAVLFTCCNVEVLYVQTTAIHYAPSSRHVCYCTSCSALYMEFFLQGTDCPTRQNKECLTEQCSVIGCTCTST